MCVACVLSALAVAELEPMASFEDAPAFQPLWPLKLLSGVDEIACYAALER